MSRMMLRVFFPAFFSLFFFSGVFAQQKPVPRPEEKKTDSAAFTKILVVPFDDKMYMSDADREICKASGLSFEELRGRFRNALVMSVYAEVAPYYSSRLLFQDNDTVHDLAYIYASISFRKEYAYAKQGRKDKPSSKINKGQLDVKRDTSEKFINIAIAQKDLLPSLFKKFGTDLFIFINELDIKNDVADYAAVGTNSYIRKLKVHYTILGKNGTQVHAGMAVITVPSSVNDAEEIIKIHFPLLARQIAAHIPVP